MSRNKGLFNKTQICGKNIYTVKSHHFAMLPWAIEKARTGTQINLVTFDYHTDTHKPFLSHACSIAGCENYEKNKEIRCEMMDAISAGELSLVESAISDLNNDEHILTALGARIIENGFVFCFSHSNGLWKNIFDSELDKDGPQKRRTYGNAFIPDPGCYVGCKAKPHDQDCVRPHRNQAIERIFLERQFEAAKNLFERQCNERIGITEVPFILDIDLDYFTTKKSLEPTDPSLFHEVMDKSLAITVALEPNYVDNIREEQMLEGSGFSSEYIYEKIKTHIERALS